jgi:hypothetical protein
MAMYEIPKEEWQEFCDSFSRLHRGWLADVLIIGQNIDHKFAAKGLPFQGISCLSKGTEKNEISIFMDRDMQDNITHDVSNPSHLRIDQDENGIHRGLEVEAKDGQKTILRFLHPAAPETIDGI